MEYSPQSSTLRSSPNPQGSLHIPQLPLSSFNTITVPTINQRPPSSRAPLSARGGKKSSPGKKGSSGTNHSPESKESLRRGSMGTAPFQPGKASQMAGVHMQGNQRRGGGVSVVEPPSLSSMLNPMLRVNPLRPPGSGRKKRVSDGSKVSVPSSATQLSPRRRPNTAGNRDGALEFSVSSTQPSTNSKTGGGTKYVGEGGKERAFSTRKAPKMPSPTSNRRPKGSTAQVAASAITLPSKGSSSPSLTGT